MSKSNLTEAQMIGALEQLEAGRKAEDVGREMGVSKHTIYGGMDVSEAQEAKQLRDEDTRLKKLVVDLSLDKGHRQQSRTIAPHFHVACSPSMGCQPAVPISDKVKIQVTSFNSGG